MSSRAPKSTRSGKSGKSSRSKSGGGSFGHKGLPETYAQLLAKCGTTRELEFLLEGTNLSAPESFDDLETFESTLAPVEEIEEDGETFVECNPVLSTYAGFTQMILPNHVETDAQIEAFVASVVLRNPYRGSGGKISGAEVFSAAHLAHIMGGPGFVNDGSSFGWNNLLTSGTLEGPEEEDASQYKKFAFRGTRVIIAIVWGKKNQFIKVSLICDRSDFTDSYEIDEETGEPLVDDDGEKVVLASADDKANGAFEDFLALMNRESLSDCTGIPAAKIVVNKGLGTYTTMSGQVNDLPIAECPDEEGLQDIASITVVRYLGGKDGYYHSDDSAEEIKIGLPGIVIQPEDLSESDQLMDVYGLANLAYQNFLESNEDADPPKLGEMEIEVKGMIMATMRSFRYNPSPTAKKGKNPTNVSIKNLNLVSIVANSPRDVKLIKAVRSGSGGGAVGKKVKTKRTRAVRAGW